VGGLTLLHSILIRWFDGNRRIETQSAGLLCGHLGRDDRYESSTGFRKESDAAIGKGEKGMILAHADIRAGMPFRAALTDDDVAGHDSLIAEALHAQALALGVATVAG
jgi:hypothetical protein